ncbi:MAG: hypothetical protein P1V97_26795 [Planctomycetota bacterium]|nr:hypothetical protein [Planctomycetota bacterium]
MLSKQYYPNLFWSSLIALWLAALAFGFHQLSQYEFSTARSLDATTSWPSESKLTPSTDGPTLLIFLHPHCPCSQATLSELERQQRYWPKNLRVTFVFIQVQGMSEDWVKTDLWKRSSRLSGVELTIDKDGREAYLFGASSSGEVRLFNKLGQSLFIGGVTPSRGHEGDSAPGQSLLSRLENNTHEPCEYPVFGCELFDNQELEQIQACCQAKD